MRHPWQQPQFIISIYTEINSLEIEFLFMINFNLYVSDKDVCNNSLVLFIYYLMFITNMYKKILILILSMKCIIVNWRNMLYQCNLINLQQKKQ